MVKLVRDVTLAAAAVAALTLAFSAIVPPAPASAQPMPSGALRQACAEDVRRLCPGIQPGGGRIQKCFIEKYDQVSSACKSAMDEARALKANGAK